MKKKKWMYYTEITGSRIFEIFENVTGTKMCMYKNFKKNRKKQELKYIILTWKKQKL